MTLGSCCHFGIIIGTFEDHFGVPRPHSYPPKRDGVIGNGFYEGFDVVVPLSCF